VLSNLQVDADGASFTLSNTSSTKAQDTVTFDVVVDGQRRYFWFPFDLKPGASYSVSVGFERLVEAPVIGVCGNRPIGIVDDPEPVLTVTVDVPSTET
jgi:hypothetical protein